MENSRRSALTIILNTFFICIAVYFIEYKFFYNKVLSIFGTTVIHKVFGIIAILVALRLLNSNWKRIGYIAKPKKIISGIFTPVVFLAISAVISIVAIKLFVEIQGGTMVIGYNSTFSEASYIRSAIIIIISVIYAFMIESLLRGLILQTANEYLRFYAANTITVILTIIWFNVPYAFLIAMNAMTTTEFVRSVICSTIIYGAAAIRKSLYVRASGAIWACLVDFFVSIMIINKFSLTVIFPYDFIPSNPIEYLASFLSSKLNNSYATIAFMCMVSVLSLVITIVYCSVLKKRARNKYIKRLSKAAEAENI